MPTIAAQSSVPAVAAVQGLSKSKDCALTVSFNGVDSAVVSPPSLYIGYGKSAAAPATFADISNPVLDLQGAGDAASFRYRAGSGLYDGSYTALNARANSGWTVGDKVFVTLWLSATPSSGDAPIAVSSQLLVVA
jgi:hypothetical protein